MVELTTEQFEAARTRGEARLRGPRAESVYYDESRDRIIVRLSTGVELGLTPGAVEGLAGASAEDLRAVEVEAQGLGLHFPRLDADLYVPALLDGVLGSRRWLASRLGTVGGQARSETKAMASRENGRKGGRPKVSGYLPAIRTKGGLIVESRPRGYAVKKQDSMRAIAVFPTRKAALEWIEAFQKKRKADQVRVSVRTKLRAAS